MELIISVLKFSIKFPIYARVSPPLAEFCAREKTSHSLVLVLKDPLEYRRHKSTIWSKGSLEMSPFPNKLSMTRKYSLIPRSRTILRTSLPIVVWPDLYTLYRSLSTKSSKLSLSFYTILNNSSLLSFCWFLGNFQVPTVGVLPGNRSQLYRPLFGMGNPSG